MSSDSKRYGSSFGRPSGSGAGSFGFEPAAASNPLRSQASSAPGPKVYSSDAFEEQEPGAHEAQGFESASYDAAEPEPLAYDATGLDAQPYDRNPAGQDDYSGFEQPQQSYDQNYDQNYDRGYEVDQPFDADDGAQTSSLRERIASRFSDSLSFSRSKPAADEAAPQDSKQDFDAASYGDFQGDDNGGYSDEYGEQGYSTDYAAQSYDSQDYSAPSYDTQGFGSGYGSAQTSGYDDGFGQDSFNPAAGEPAESRPATGWRSRFANRTADLAGSSASFQDSSQAYADGNDAGYEQDYAASGFGAQDYAANQSYDSGAYNAQNYGAQNYGAQNYGAQNYSDDYSAQDYGDDFNDADLYSGQPGSGALAGGSLKSPGLKRGLLGGLDLSSKWIMPAGSIAVGVLVLAVLLYLFNPFAGNPLETPESIAAVETMLAGLDIDPGAQDGIADDAYRLAIVEFQEMHGLAQTGELTPEVFQEMTAIYELSNL